MRLAVIDHDGWQLESAEARHAASPETFLIPPRAAREAMGPGDGAKLLFRFRASEAEGLDGGVERMWVIVRRRAGGLLVGVLDSTPMTESPLSRGDDVVFGVEHVAALDRPSRAYVLERYGVDFFDGS